MGGGPVLTSEQEHALKAGDQFSECKKGCPTMVAIPAGKFMMGSPESEKGDVVENEKGKDDELPQHEVKFAKPFAGCKFEVTLAEWDTCVRAGAHRIVAGAGATGR
jgi:formylglycine-generating enzyme required for sulfatase activity